MMSLNSSSSSTHTPLDVLSSPSNGSDSPLLFHCFDSRITISMCVALTVTRFSLLLPLYIFIVFLSCQRRRQQHSYTTSHSDIFTYNTMIMELISMSGWTLFCSGASISLPQMKTVGYYVLSIIFPGEIFFQILTCVERYLAVVHPITYLGLKRSGGVRIRNGSIVCVWLLSFGWSGPTFLYYPELPSIPLLSLLLPSLIVVSFCSISALCVLIRPRPGDVCGARERVDQSKQRASHTVMAIVGVLWLWFAGYATCIVLDLANLLSDHEFCVMIISGIWMSLPRSLVLPLLFLHRAGKLPF